MAAQFHVHPSASSGSDLPAVIVTPAGSTIEPEGRGGYRVCDREHHCTHADSLWQAQQLVQWAEVHHRPPGDPEAGRDVRF